MHKIRKVGRLAVVVFAVAATFVATSLCAKPYTILLKDGGGVGILGSGVFDWEPGITTVDFPATLTLFGTTFNFNFIGAEVDFETDHASCEPPDAPPELKVCPSRVRSVTGSAVADGFPDDFTLVLSDPGSRDDRLGVWDLGAQSGTTFLTSEATIPAPASVLLLLVGLPILAFARRRLRRD